MLGLIGIASLSDHTGDIVYSYFALLLFVFVALPLHVVGIPLVLYQGFKNKDHKQRAWQYAYFGAWIALSAFIFGRSLLS